MSTLNYNIRWIEQTFHSLSLTESLLSPERESGNLTTNDYELAIRFLPGFHRHYRVLGGVAAIPIVYALRKPSWSGVKTYAALFIGIMAGFAAGHTVSVAKHYNFVRTLENPIGFSKAMDNVQHRVGSVMPTGPVIVRQSHSDKRSDVDNMDESCDAAITGRDGREPRVSPAMSNPGSKWEQIRAMNARSAPVPSWEAIRQKHGKSHLSKSGVVVNNQEGQSEAPPNEMAAEQAEFDAMLERERRTNSRNYRT